VGLRRRGFGDVDPLVILTLTGVALADQSAELPHPVGHQPGVQQRGVWASVRQYGRGEAENCQGGDTGVCKFSLGAEVQELRIYSTTQTCGS
jgi:hypothetical protein